jgi:hypothetical protein
MSDLDRFPNIYCPECKKVRELVLDEFESGEKEDHAAADIVCPQCGFIIATLHTRPA